MTTLESALADTSHLAPFDGRPVVRTTIAVTNAGDGLSEALAVDPRELHHGERVFVVLECEVAKVTFTPVRGATDLLVRVHTLRAGGATMVDPETVEEQLAAQADRIALAREQAQGIARIGNPDQLVADHDEGRHVDEPVDECPECYPPEPTPTKPKRTRKRP